MRPTRAPRSLTVQVADLRVEFPGAATGRSAVEGVDLTVAPATVHAVVGESGSGKSTLLRTISGSLPPTATARGAVTLTWSDTAGSTQPPVELLSVRRGRRSLLPPTSRLAGRVVGTMPQSAATALTPVRTFGAQLAETCAHLGSVRGVEELVAAAMLQPADLARYPHELSGGMAQRAAFALAIAGDPPLLLADEPTSALDPQLTEQLLGLLRRHADEGGTVLLVTHDLEELERSQIADEITVMHRGRVLESGGAAQVLTDPSHPYTRLMLDALPSRGLHHPTAAQVRAALTQTEEAP